MQSTHGLSEKIYLCLRPSESENSDSNADLILRELSEQGFSACFSLPALRALSLLCDRQEDRWHLTFTLSLTFGGSSSAAPVWTITEVEKGDTRQCHYGYAIDLGSTTIAVRLMHLATGNILHEVRVFNKQIPYGEDILTRIFYGREKPAHTETLRKAAVDSLCEAFDHLASKTGITPSMVSGAALAGNACMIHFLLGLDAFCLFSAPYIMHVKAPGFISGNELGLPIHGNVYIFPAITNYVGGDIVSGLLAVNLLHNPDPAVLFDVGTNGELVIGCRDYLLCGAGAAGPALEGASVITGMKAELGAVTDVSFENGSFICHTVGNVPPVGICGSGIVDLISALFMNGLIDLKGHFIPESSPLITRRPVPGSDKIQYAVTYAPGLYFYQQDLDTFIRTKSAAFTMMEILMEQIGLSTEDILAFYMCGSFGEHIHKTHAINIGMYPDVPESKIHPAGNTSLEGCTKLLCRRDLLADIDRILSMVSYIQFGSVDNFPERMRGAAALPHTDSSLFPSVQNRLKELRGHGTS